MIEGRGESPSYFTVKQRTTKEFIKLAVQKHGGFYNYDKVEYQKSNLKVTITCPEHGDFKQTPNQHLLGNGCPTCARIRTTAASRKRAKSPEEYLSKCLAAHGNKYDYSESIFTKTSDEITIICKDHGKFKQRLGNHIHGARCPDCAKKAIHAKRRMSYEYFVEKARFVHNDAYDYSNTTIISGHTKSTAFCEKHGEFEMIPSAHLAGVGCRKCGYDRNSKRFSLTQEEFLLKCKNIHGDRYDYQSVKYSNYENPVEIICKEHGSFMQRPSVHLKGCGCPKCNKKFYDGDYHEHFSETCLYLFEIITTDLEYHFLKVGISLDPQGRAKFISKELDGAFVEPIIVLKGPSVRICEFEEGLHENPELDHIFIGKRFGGFTECYFLSQLESILKLIHDFNKSTDEVEEICSYKNH